MTDNYTDLTPIVIIILPIIGAGFGYFIKHLIEKKKELLSKVNNERRQHYQMFIDIVIDIFSKSKTSKTFSQDTTLIKLFEFQKKFMLYASPKVIISFSDHMQYLYKIESKKIEGNPTKQFKLMTKIIKEMRSDLGLKNFGLGKDGELLIRSLLNDFDKYFK